jgi:hypothetical protein
MNETRRALVVAIDRYVHPMLHKLAAPTADAAALARVLGEEDLGGFEVTVLTDADSHQVTQAVEELLGDAKSSDLVLLHFSCHGIKDDSGELFLAATNTVPHRLVSTAVEAAMVSRLIQRSRAQRVVLLLDCCYGGAFERGVVARAGGDVDVASQFTQQHSLGGGRGRVVITASAAMEYAFEGATLTDDSGPSPSLFTGALVEGITSGEADRDQDGQVGLDELYDYIHTKVHARTPNQTPSKWEFGMQGEVYIARNPRRKITPVPLPDELGELIAHPAASVRLASVGDLDQLAGGHNLRLAAAARLALEQLRDDDSRRVSTAAIAALDRTALRVTPAQVELGQVAIGSTPQAQVRIDGGPLALASSIEVTHEHLHARIEGSSLSIITSATELGQLDEHVKLSGPAGDATVDITGTVAATPVTEAHIGPQDSQPAERATIETDDGAQLSEPVETQPTDQREAVDHRDGGPDEIAVTDREAPEEPPAPATTGQDTGRRRAAVLVGAVVVLLLGATLIAVLVTRSSDQTPEASTGPSTVPSPFQSAALYGFARYLFDVDVDNCYVPQTQDETPLIWGLPHNELVKCESANQPYTAVFWCTQNLQDLQQDRGVYLNQAVNGTERRLTEPPAGHGEPVDGVQTAFKHVQNMGARVYWDSQAGPCAGELQAYPGDNNVDAIVNYWLNGWSG